ncbi:Transposon Ty3-G Gag-Pol poly [Paramuricea clavata]|uniref:Transposon Ty3-G Gag-Pol poly n=1 Tax=Paramuricea clavata TaxID=317549 RepID=A0A6S7LSS4_PARCT|nr:Transposon Ty3-G Gag-Pol poly [Paramuricea clavata]
MLTSYPLSNLLHVTETLDRLAEASYFTSTDMVFGYHQVEVADEDKEKTTFTSSDGLFHDQYCRMPYGLAGAPATFQSVVEVLETEDIMAYLDDVICFHVNFDKYLEGIQKLLAMVRRAGFKLSGKKCQFAKLSVGFLGHIIDNIGVRLLPEKLDIIRNWKATESQDKLRRFLGVCTFWRRLVKEFSKIAVPLHKLLNKEEFLWTNKWQDAFNLSKKLLCSSMTLKLPQRVGRFSNCDM